jgi:hypothetical protein
MLLLAPACGYRIRQNESAVTAKPKEPGPSSRPSTTHGQAAHCDPPRQDPPGSVLDNRTYVRLEYSHHSGARLLLSLSPLMDGHQLLIGQLNGRKGRYRCTGATRR